ncbi:MAG: beta galactosidase jelly roll domain-containing protein, partial [Gemmatimonadota bacterium]|nr:beta galactosidase jelly roll domain-containing protein [Gemmatimonadota bacterium]
MSALSRRGFVRKAGTAGVAASLGSLSTVGCSSAAPEPCAAASGCNVCLSGTWRFRLDPKGEGESKGWHLARIPADGWTEVRVPHTWQVSPDLSGYMGVAWYCKDFEAPASWAVNAVRLEFEAVYHSATVWLNGKPVGEHLRKGYTAFMLDISSAVCPGEKNTLMVKVDNSFDMKMLPRGSSFDWAVDGGITRPVNLLITCETFIERVDIDTRPDIENARAGLDIKVALQNGAGAAVKASVNYRVIEEDTGCTVLEQREAAEVNLEPGEARKVTLSAATLNNPRLWHFDHPYLYRLEVEIECRGKPLHKFSTIFGVRKIEVREGGFYLNGERVWLMGVER